MLWLFIYRCVSWSNRIGSIYTSTIGLIGLSMPRVSRIYSLPWFISPLHCIIRGTVVK